MSFYLSGSFYIQNNEALKPVTCDLWPNGGDSSTTGGGTPTATVVVTASAAPAYVQSSSSTAVIAVLVTLVVLLTLALLVSAFCWRAHRRRQKRAQQSNPFASNLNPRQNMEVYPTESLPPTRSKMSFPGFLRSWLNKGTPTSQSLSQTQSQSQPGYPESAATITSVSAFTSELPNGFIGHELPGRNYGTPKQQPSSLMTRIWDEEEEEKPDEETKGRQSPLSPISATGTLNSGAWSADIYKKFENTGR